MQIFGQPKAEIRLLRIGGWAAVFRLCTEKKKIFEKNKIRGLQPWIFVIYYLSIRGGIAQLGEHLPCKQGVKSSNLFISTTTSRRAFWFAAFFIKKYGFTLSAAAPLSRKTYRVLREEHCTLRCFFAAAAPFLTKARFGRLLRLRRKYLYNSTLYLITIFLIRAGLHSNDTTTGMRNSGGRL